MTVIAKAEVTISDILDGNSISEITNFYKVSSKSSGETAPQTSGGRNLARRTSSEWSTTVPTLTPENKYLWNYEMITGSDGQVISYTEPRVIGVYGDKGQNGSTGATGNGIKSITEYYQISTSNTTAPTSWVTTVPTLTATNKYLWNYEKITYTNGTSVDTAKRVIGVYGDKGQTGATGPAGKGIKSTAITYQASTSGTTAPTGTWNTSVPSVPQGQYLWSRTVITYTDNSTSTTYSVAYIPKNGQNGATGATGTGVASIVQQYYLSTSKTSQTGGSWVTSMPTWSSGKYLWTRYQINYKNPTSTAYTSPICDSSWEAANEAAKTATNYMNFDNNGLVIGDLTKGTLGRNVLIDSDSVDIRNGTNVLATFSDNIIELGKGNTNSAIKLCDGAGTIDIDDSLTGYNLLKLKTKDDISGLTLQSTMVTIAQPSRSPTDSTATISVYGDLPAPGLDTTSSYIQLECRNGGGGSSFIGMYADKTHGVYDQSMSLKVEPGDMGSTSLNITKNRFGLYLNETGREMVFNPNGITFQEKKEQTRTSLRLMRTRPNGSMWVYGRKEALIVDGEKDRADAGNYRPLASSRTRNGSWDIGTIDDKLCFSYISDSRYSSGTNGVDTQIEFINEGGGKTYTYGYNRMLWEGAAFMHGSQTIYLNGNITDQPHGVVLIWCRYINGAIYNERFNSFFIPKGWVARHNGGGMNFDLTGSFNYATKYVYIYNNHFNGHADNTGVINSADGSIWRNNEHVLRYVIGV